ncbi:MAG: monovalent cation:proton antiporter family protein [Thermoleophilia bacterium]
MEESYSYAPLLVVIGLAFIVPLLLLRFRRLGLPIVVGEIIAGIVIGRSGFDLVKGHDPVLELLSQLGFVFLMFLAGMEIDLSGLRIAGFFHPRKGQWSPLQLGALSFLLTIIIAAVLSLGLARLGGGQNIWMMTLILSTTSLGVVLPVLKESGLSSSLFGQVILTTAMIADFATMLLITVLVAVVSGGASFEILLIGLLFVAFFIIYRTLALFFKDIPGFRRAIEELSHASAQIKVRAAFAMMLVFVALSQALGTELILGAFLAGLIMSLLSTPDDAGLSGKLEAIGYGFFIPIFFIMVGVSFNFAALTGSARSLLLVPLFLAAAVAVKMLPALVLRLQFTWRECLAAGALLSARLSLIIAASAIGLRLGIISESVNAAIILVAAVTVTVAPVVFSRLAPRRSAVVAPIVIASAGELALQVAARLKAHGEALLLVDPDDDRVRHARSHGYDAEQARLDQGGAETGGYLERAHAVICTSTDTDYNYRISRLARQDYGVEHVVVQVNDERDRDRFQELGVMILNPALDRVAMFALVSRNPDLYQLITRTDDDKEVIEATVRNTRFTNQPLSRLRLPGDMLVLALRRRNELLVPQGDTRLSLGDRLTLVGSVESVDEARRLLADLK